MTYVTLNDQRHAWKQLLGGLMVLLFAWYVSWGYSLFHSGSPDVGLMISQFSEQQQLTQTQQDALTQEVAAWLHRDHTLAERPVELHRQFNAWYTTQ